MNLSGHDSSSVRHLDITCSIGSGHRSGCGIQEVFLEMHYVFTGHTGWLVPLNVASWLDCVRPVPCRGVKVKALGVHETQYPEP